MMEILEVVERTDRKPVGYTFNMLPFLHLPLVGTFLATGKSSAAGSRTGNAHGISK